MSITSYPHAWHRPRDLGRALVAALVLLAVLLGMGVTGVDADANAGANADSDLANDHADDQEPCAQRQTKPQQPVPSDASNDPALRWLDAVRAQREALAEYRKNLRDAHRRAFDPRASLSERRIEEHERQRARILQQRDETFRRLRGHGPWMQPPWLFGAPADTGTDPGDEFDPTWEADSGARGHAPPPGWDNGWYYRGW